MRKGVGVKFDVEVVYVQLEEVAFWSHGNGLRTGTNVPTPGS